MSQSVNMLFVFANSYLHCTKDIVKY